ncbi:Arm DNA-binding domain-containing protein [Sphingomonas sp. 7/4-4]|uniref:Arm DNA-binding domain-containing protein n=1 Tax=Sphingomonas sp. 7/4-4 TaxID=3018446 RepID=UPI0022F390FD|nr:Arm DNA-binding domain-containing protein [Sphingomonas sp. 7/4-4]WBY06818.1 Arm DNA-binding domain-containing protein [Sphingomonas sp. 7/4-4]
MALKELEARYATKRAKDYKLADGGGLYLLIRPNGSKLWRFKYRFDGKLLSPWPLSRSKPR